MISVFRIYYAVAYLIKKTIFPCHVSGLENIPEGPAIVCANHSSFLDPVHIVYAFGRKRRLYFMAKKELFEVPIIRSFLRAVGAFPVERGETDIGAIRTAMRLLKDGRKVMIFPEGTRITEEQAVSAKNGAVRIAVKMNVPLVPIFISKRKRAFRFARLVIGEPYYLDKPADKDYIGLSTELMQKIYELENKN